MKDAKYINIMLLRWEGRRRKALTDANDLEFQKACAVIRNLKIILEIKNKKQGCKL